jgi:hypothetical protein
MKIHEFQNLDFKGHYPTFELCEVITKVVVTPNTPSLAFLREYDIEADVHVRQK